MDQDTGPPSAVRVNELLDPTVSAMLFVETLSVPSVGADGDESAPPLAEPPLAAVPVPVEVVGVATGALLADEPPLSELGVVALPVGVDCDTLSVRDEGDGDAEGFVVAGVAPDGFAWPGL
jgi:hypothetical protein